MGEAIEAEAARLEAIRRMVRVEIDGDWDARMIELAFDELERIVDGRPSAPPSPSVPPPAAASAGRRGRGRGRRR
jgi:hypothetical protein